MIPNSSVGLHTVVVIALCHTADASRAEQSSLQSMDISVRHCRTSDHKVEKFCRVLL